MFYRKLKYFKYSGILVFILGCFLFNITICSKAYYPYKTQAGISFNEKRENELLKLFVERVLAFEDLVADNNDADSEDIEDSSLYEIDLVLQVINYNQQFSYEETSYKKNFPKLTSFLRAGYYLQVLQPPKNYNVT